MAKAKKEDKTKQDKPRVTLVKRLWGVVNHSAEQVEAFLQELSENNFGGKLQYQTILHEHIRESQFDMDAHIWIVVSAHALELLCQKRIDISHATIILLDTCAIVTQYKGITLLDSEQIKSYHFKFKKLDSATVLRIRKEPVKELFQIECSKVSIVPELLNAQPPSLLHQLMTFAYTVDSAKRAQYMLDVFNMIISGSGRIEALSWYNPENKRMAAFAEWLSTEVGDTTCKALSAALNKVKGSDKSPEFRYLAEQHNVDKFDINYAVEFMKRNAGVTYPQTDTAFMFALDPNRPDAI